MIEKYFFALILTIVTETTAGYVLGYRKLKHILGFIGINFVTNICLNIALFYYPSVSFLLSFELIVFIIETVFYHYLFKIKFSEALKLSLILNLITFILGLILKL